jgi:hypothetical protein
VKVTVKTKRKKEIWKILNAGYSFSFAIVFPSLSNNGKPLSLLSHFIQASL